MFDPGGYTWKFDPLIDVPTIVPPLDAVHQLIIPFAAVAFKFEYPPHVIVCGFAVTFTGFVGGLTTTVTDDLVELHGKLYVSA